MSSVTGGAVGVRDSCVAGGFGSASLAVGRGFSLGRGGVSALATTAFSGSLLLVETALSGPLLLAAASFSAPRACVTGNGFGSLTVWEAWCTGWASFEGTSDCCRVWAKSLALRVSAGECSDVCRGVFGCVWPQPARKSDTAAPIAALHVRMRGEPQDAAILAARGSFSAPNRSKHRIPAHSGVATPLSSAGMAPASSRPSESPVALMPSMLAFDLSKLIPAKLRRSGG
jgi:hypothetical protein